MIALYVFALVLGGGFLGLALFGDLFGGHGDVDLSGDLGGHDAQLRGDAGHGAAAKIFSIRTVTYSLFGFGAVGTSLALFGTGIAAATTAALSVGTGLVSGVLINGLFTWVKRGESGELAEEEGYEGHLGRVTLPIEGSGGKILVEFAGREVELPALPHASASGDASRWRRVLVVEMDRGVALVAPAEGDTYLTS